jgi:hypothetical protein
LFGAVYGKHQNGITYKYSDGIEPIDYIGNLQLKNQLPLVASNEGLLRVHQNLHQD